MKKLWKITALETKLFFRDPAAWIVALLLPTVILLILGAIPGMRVPQAVFGGHRFIDVFVPSLIVVTLATLGISSLPTRLVSYREKGVLRRLSTTPVNPAALLFAQLAINMVMALAAVGLLVIAGNLALQIPLPRHPIDFLAALLVGMSSLFALGLLVAAIAPTSRTSGAVTAPLYLLVMFVGGVYVPRVFLPDFLVRIGEYSPPGVQALLDAWQGVAPQPWQLAVLAAITVVAGLAAARLFRWE